MPIKKVQKQLKIRYKYLISAGVLVTSVGITFGGIYGYALNSFQVQGHPYFLKNLNNAFVFDDATVQKNILSGDKKTKLGFWNEKTDEIVANGYKQKWHDFITTYYHQNKANIILHLKYGPFNFYNEYPEAVSGVEFKKFTDWFVQNVPWGVEATTLKSFSIVRGVERKGNAITLGEHENKNKEATEITFYPDAFFGSAPIYSELSGAGNADDALTYKINQNLWNDAQAQTYLEQIPLYNVIANDFTPDSVKISFDKLTAAHLLVGTKLFFDEQNHYVVNAANTTAALMLLKQQYPNSSFNAANLKYKVISKVVINPQRNLVLTLVDDTQAYETFWQDPNRQIQVYNDLINQYKRNRFLPYDLEQKMYEKSFENATAKIELTLGRFEDASVFALDQINQAWQQQFVNVYDLYHIKRFFFHKYFYYYEGHKELFADKISAWDGIKDFDPQKLHQVSLVQINHNANKNKFELVLAKTKDKPSGATTSFSFLELNNDSQALIKLEVSQTDLAFFTSLSVALGYKKQVQPELVYKEDEIRFNDDHIEKKYRIYNAAYQDLLDTLKQQAPNALLPLQGEHLQKYVDQKGSLRYRIANGFYWGFRPSTDVPLWAILKASKPTFSGISHDFLKFVAAHEYGHHLTLTTLQDVSDKGTSPLLIGALRPNSPPTSIQNYWNKSLVELFLNARTNLTVTGQKLKDLGTNVLSETGEYPVFGFRSQNNKPVFETYEDVFGDALLSNNLAATLANKKRRFLQNYDGLKQAVAERKKAGINNISLSDLYLLNSWDTSSGTINPGFSGNAKFLFWNQQQQKYQFQPASVQNLARVITDGLNQPIRFSSFNRPMVLQWNRSYNQVEAILIHNKDGSPVFNVPLNTPLSRDEISAIRVKERQIQDLILSLNVANYSVNGWELPTTNFDPKIVTSIAINHFVQWVNNRDLTNEEVVLMDEDNRKITDYFPLFGDKIPGFVFSFLNPRISETAKIFLESIFNSKLVSGSDKGIYTFDKEEAKEQIAKIVYFFKNNVSVLSYLAGSLPPDLAGISNFSDLITDLGTNYEKYGFTNEQELSKNQINVLYWQFLDFIYKFESKDTQKRATDTTGLLFKIDNNYYSINPNHTLSFKEVPGFQTIDRAGTLLKALVSFDAASKPFIWTNDDNEQVSLNEDTIKTTPNTSLKLNPKFSIFNANAEKKQKFSTLKELFTFVAIDYTKFDGTNWDVNYVKEKFDIEKIKIAKPEWQNASDQMVANATMAAFMRSDSAFLMQVRFFNELNAQNFGWVFNQTNGLKGYQNPSVDDTNKTNLWEQIDQFVTDNGLQKDKLTSLDLIFFSPSVRVILPQYNNDRDLEANLAGFSPIFLSQDVIDYFNLKTEARLDDKFANYVFDPAEWTNRDWLQISYSPGVSAFGDAPGFIGNLNEANSGFEYVVDGYASQKWANLATDFLPGLRAIYTHLLNTRDTNLLKVNDLFAIRQPRNSNFLGKLRSISNGWYKDRFFREKTDGLIYDDMGMSIHDDTINITDFQGKKVTDRAYAMWIYLLRSQYIGNGNLTQIWRNDDLDAISMFGYLRSDIAHQVAYLALENLANKEIVYVPVHTKNTSNLFYYKTQNPTNETNTNARHYLKDEAWVDGDQKGVGFVGWVSDYMISGNYQNALLKPNNKYKLYFVNQNKQYVANLSLGNRQSAAENGKAYSQAPVRAQKVNDGVEVEVRSQFNV